MPHLCSVQWPLSGISGLEGTQQHSSVPLSDGATLTRRGRDGEKLQGHLAARGVGIWKAGWKMVNMTMMAMPAFFIGKCLGFLCWESHKWMKPRAGWWYLIARAALLQGTANICRNCNASWIHTVVRGWNGPETPSSPNSLPWAGTSARTECPWANMFSPPSVKNFLLISNPNFPSFSL